MNHKYVDKKLTPIDRDTWIELSKDGQYCTVMKTTVCCLIDRETKEFEVVTSWIGYDRDEKPKLFRPFGTRVFFKNLSTDLAGFLLKSETMEEAMELHEKTCKKASSGFYPIPNGPNEEIKKLIKERKLANGESVEE